MISVLALLLGLTPLGAAQDEGLPSFTLDIIDYPTTIQPGETYNIKVRVTRPTGIILPNWGSAGDTKWEVRVYFYDSTNCYVQGEWTLLGGTYIYSGWWNSRQTGDLWGAALTDTREFTIPVKVINYPRPDAQAPDGSQTMTDLPVGKECSLRARFRLRIDEGSVTFENVENENRFTLTYYGQEYQGTYIFNPYNKQTTEGSKENYNYKLENTTTVYLEWSSGGYWEIDYDKTIGRIAVSGGGGFGIPIELVLVGGIILAVVIAAIFLARRRGGEEFPPIPEYAPPPPPEAPPALPEAPPEAPPETPPPPESNF